MRLFSHVDLRVRDRNRAKAFYDVLFAPLGMASEVGQTFTTYTIDPDASEGEWEWFGFTEAPDMVPGFGRIAIFADTREIVDDVAKAAQVAGAGAIEGPSLVPEYTPSYYAVFFEDPDGNKLEVCCLTPEFRDEAEEDGGAS
ncbi:MAG: VOC family protein [Candidatus Eremiobacteraeota bacterium]|nr:VOC family protein [Candidatus Eremiobacteraeota bacterium]MBV9647973.1 VOC family protein [Candidatus Eremiobacteraeota bacterium]